MHVLTENGQDRSHAAGTGKLTHSPHSSVFLVCPFCQIENVIGKQTGAVYFLTAPASVFHIYDDDFFAPVDRFIEREHITHVYIVADTSCLFINNVLANGRKYDIGCELFIRQLADSQDTPQTLTEKVLKQEIALLRQKKVFAGRIAAGKLMVYGLLTDKAEATVAVIY